MKYVLLVIDHSSCWCEFAALPDVSASTVANAFISLWVCRYGVPARLVTDRGAQFCGSLFRSLCTLLGANHAPTTAYHPQSNGLIERVHRKLKPPGRSLCTLYVAEPTPLVGLGNPNSSSQRPGD